VLDQLSLFLSRAPPAEAASFLPDGLLPGRRSGVCIRTWIVSVLSVRRAESRGLWLFMKGKLAALRRRLCMLRCLRRARRGVILKDVPLLLLRFVLGATVAGGEAGYVAARSW
jgi:hypothetical protein